MSRTSDPALRAYLNDIAAIPLLTHEQELELARDCQSPDPAIAEQARRELAEGNLRLVVHLAKGYSRKGVQLLDLIQEGNLGLLRATEDYDPARGARFATYATEWIRSKLYRAINQSRTVRLPESIDRDLGDLAHEKNELSKKGEPTTADLAKKLDWPEDKVRDRERLALGEVSLDQPVGDGDSVLGSLVVDRTASPEAPIVQAQLQATVAAVVDALPETQAAIIRLRYGLGDEEALSREDAANALGLKGERVLQLEKKALARMRHPAFRRVLNRVAYRETGQSHIGGLQGPIATLLFFL
jgi:RNA polymerase primary sigma factor